eukprot:gene36908-biopygen31368
MVLIQTEQVDRAHLTDSGVDFYTINPKGNAPPGTIAPPNGTEDRAILQNVLSYASTEVHTSIGGLFNSTNPAEVVKHFRDASAKKLEYLENHLIGDKQFVVGNKFTIGDAYLCVVLNWTNFVAIDLTPYPRVKAYLERIGNLPDVKAAQRLMATKPTTSVLIV